MDNIITDKLTETYTLGIPEVTKFQIDKLPAHFRKKLNAKILVEMAKIIHESKFDPNLYLSTD